MKTHTYFEIQDGSGCISNGRAGIYSFKTLEEAVNVATEFKNNPRSHNEKMSDENVKYWSNKNYTIVKKVIQTEEIQTI